MRALANGRRMRVLGVVLCFALALLAVPQLASPFTNLQLSLILAYGVAIAGLDVVVGHTGQVSLGQSAFFGLGAYASAIAFDRGWPTPAALLLAVAVSAGVGGLASLPAARLRGFAFGAVTFALPVVAVPLAIRLDGLTGGSEGLAVRVVRAPAWSGLEDDQWRLIVVALVAAAALLLISNLLRGRLGRAFAVIRSHETVGLAVGIPVQRYKSLAFTVAATFGGLAGWLFVVAVQFVSPDVLQLSLAISMLAALVVGGRRSRLGALIGASFYVLVPNLSDKVSPGRSYLIDGICLLLVLIFFRNGVAGALRSAAHSLGIAGRSPDAHQAAMPSSNHGGAAVPIGTDLQEPKVSRLRLNLGRRTQR